MDHCETSPAPTTPHGPGAFLARKCKGDALSNAELEPRRLACLAELAVRGSGPFFSCVCVPVERAHIGPASSSARGGAVNQLSLPLRIRAPLEPQQRGATPMRRCVPPARRVVPPQRPYATLHSQAASNSNEMKAIATAAPFTAAFNT
jgi:hypothetical protein